jgi:signal transduction histidine kinase
VLLAGVLASNVIGLVVYAGDRLDVMMQGRAQQIAEQVATAAETLEVAEPAARRGLVRAMRQPGLRLFWSQRPFLTADDTGGRNDRVLPEVLREAFRTALGDETAGRLRLALDARPPPRPSDIDDTDGGPRRRGGPPWAPAPDTPPGAPEMRFLTGSLRLDDGSWLNFAAPIASFPPFWATSYFLVLLASTTLVLAVSVWAVRRALQPLQMFAEAADRLGRDVDAPPLPDEGPLEVRKAALAFNGMQQRLRAFVRDRTQMLAAISHDLRTPLTRLRLRAELIEDEDEQGKIIADLDEMRAMIDATLSFARDDSAVEQAATLDLAVLLQTVCEAVADAGGEATYDGPTHAAYAGRPTALRRAFANLVENAISYGKRARVVLAVGRAEHIVTIDDDGPGIPESEHERVFEPFYRLEGSRSRESGGTGLGLAVVRATIAAHGGSVSLVNRPEGGLRACVILPAAVRTGLSGGH